MDPDGILFFIPGIQINPISAGAVMALCISGLLFCISALLSASENAFFSLSSNDKRELEDSKTARDLTVVSLLQIPCRLLITIRLWNFFLSLGAVMLFTYAFHLTFDFTVPLSCLMLEIVVIAFLILFFMKILPKVYIQRRSLSFARTIAPYLKAVVSISRPVATLLESTVRFVFYASRKKSNDVFVEELSKTSELTSGELTEEKEMFKGVIGLYNKTSSRIMTAWMDVAALNIKTEFHDAVRYAIETGYSRIPVYAGTTDDIKGVLYVKDLLPYLDQHAEFHWQKVIRPAYFVPENKKVNDLLKEFRATKTHIAIVIDEFGSSVGIVTMEDILEEIVGEINDEYDEDEHKFIKLKDGNYIFDAKILLTDFFRETGINPKTFGHLTDEVDTLAGLILEIKCDLPKKKEVISFGNYSFLILEIDRKRILKVKFSIVG
ncbi:MAG: gliding motility-associated protein GldE [Dysgonamonadaceae bacterium]|jgi:gliding motility-associated protein GldE|nr:gliding motility-associated protein GldE [Dysgonamonadaceae bacterium]